ncbi:hypothetical protein [Mucilaginibacter sp.]|uniref:hypothetical protein n=1 Tax=Mucilaginibacter sp. TaxID=1882438 RepID=UPI0026339015|nr:hypothetical protein [Mucilaginibacter sp.]MDB4918959.1 hypothetical protein [Mucilaginibacter sp.]
MFNLFKKKQIPSINHQHKNLLISLPLNWKYEFEEGDQEACFDPKSQSTLRLNVIKVTPPEGKTPEENIKDLTVNQPYVTTSKGYLLTKPAYRESLEDGNNITLVTWKLINYDGDEKTIAVLSYTVLSEEKDSEQEKEIFNLLENSLQNSELLN